jgi:hypothetical protein
MEGEEGPGEDELGMLVVGLAGGAGDFDLLSPDLVREKGCMVSGTCVGRQVTRARQMTAKGGQ